MQQMKIDECQEKFCSNEAFNSKQRKHTRRNFLFVCVGAVLLLSGYSCFFVLQSSINVESGLGSLILTTTYTTTVLSCLLLGPFLLRLLGVKKTFITAECCYILCVCANIYPTSATMFIAGMLGGYSEGVYWSILYVVMLYYAKVYHQYSTKSLALCVGEFLSVGYGIIQLNQIVGNSLNSFVFHFLTTDPPSFNANGSYRLIAQTTPISTMTGETPTFQQSNLIKHCGINDCLDPNVTSTSIGQYVPQDRTVIYILSGSCMALMLVGALLHFFLMAEMPLEILNERIKSNDLSEEIDDEEKRFETNENNEDLNKNYFKNSVNKNEKRSLKKVFFLSFHTIKDVFSILITFRQLLVIPVTVGFGIGNGFMYSELTRAFTSCILGVSQVGICILFYSLAYISACFVIRHFCLKLSRMSMACAAYIIYVGNFFAFLLWQPSYETSWIIYCFFGGFGISSSIWTVILNSIYGSEEYKNKEVSTCLFNSLFSIGLAIQYGLSTVLCVRTKVYIVIIIITLGTVLLGVREKKFKRLKCVAKKESSQKENA